MVFDLCGSLTLLTGGGVGGGGGRGTFEFIPLCLSYGCVVWS